MTVTVENKPVYAPTVKGGGKKRNREALPAPTSAKPSDEVTARFLQLLIPIAATTVNTFGSQIGSAVGGVIGGAGGAKTGSQVGGAIGDMLGKLGGGLNLGSLFGGRSVLASPTFDEPTRLPVDVTGPQVQQCTLECIADITPDLVTMLRGIGPRLASEGGDRSGAADAEFASLERFWPEITGFLGQQVAKHLPDIVKKVTSSVLPLLGTRDTSAYTPILTGTEATARWFLPVLNSVLTAVQQSLPDLLGVLGGKQGAAARDTAITWTDLSVYGRFWDNDFIRVVGQQDIADKNAVELVLELAPHLSWAKEIQVRDDNGALIARLHVQDSTKSAEVNISADQILTNGSLLFLKAKLFGIMTGLYVLPTAGLDEVKGKRTVIRWMSD